MAKQVSEQLALQLLVIAVFGVYRYIMVYNGNTVGIQLVHGINLVYIWYTVGIQLVYSWYTVGTQLVYNWNTMVYNGISIYDCFHKCDQQ